MNKDMRGKYGLKHSFILNQWAALDILLICVISPGITEEHQEDSQRNSSGVPSYLPCLTFQDVMWQDQHA